MVVALKIKPWDPIAGLTHTSTSWRVATDIGMTNILDELLDSTTYLTLYYSNITIPTGVVYYAQAQRTLSDGTVLPWTEPIPVRNDNNSEAILLYKDITIEVPIIKIDENSLLNTSTDLIINSSPSKFVGDGHFATHWIIENSSGDVIYTSLYDEVNTTSITIPKTLINFINLNYIKVKVIYISGTGVESKPGVLTKQIYQYNFDIPNNLYDIDPNIDLNIVINKINSNSINGIRKMNLKAKNSDEILYSEDYTVEIDNITLPKELLVPDSELILELHVSDSNHNGIARYYIKTNSDETNRLFLDTNKTYNYELTHLGTDSVDIFDKSTFFETFDYKILAGIKGLSNIRILEYNKETNSVVDTFGSLIGTSLYNYTDGIYIRVLVGNIILVDGSVNGNAVFSVYDYNPINNQTSLRHSNTRTTEINATGINNSIIHLDNDNIIYLPVDNATNIKQYTISTNTITELETFPTDPITNGTLIDLGKGRILLIGGDNTKTFIYNITTNTWTDGIAYPIEFRNYPLKANKLLNGDTIIYRTIKDSTYTDDNILLYKKLDNVFETINPGTDNSNPLVTSFSLNNGEVILTEPNTTGVINNFILK